MSKYYKTDKILHFHDTDSPENVFRGYSSHDVQSVVNNLCDKIDIKAPKVELFNDPGHIYTSYYECTKVINVSKAAVANLPKYAWVGMIAHEIGHHYALQNDFHFSSDWEEELFADRIASKLTSPQAVIRSLTYYIKNYDPTHKPQDLKKDQKRVHALQKIENLQNSVTNALFAVVQKKDTNKQSAKATVTASASATAQKSQANSASESAKLNKQATDKKKQKIAQKQFLDTLTHQLDSGSSASAGSASASASSTDSKVKAIDKAKQEHQEQANNLTNVIAQNINQGKKKKNVNRNINHI